MARRLGRARTPAILIAAACAAALALLVAAPWSGAPAARTPAPAGRPPRPVPVTGAADTVARKLRAAGLPITVTVRFTPATDPDHLLGRAGGCVSKVAFADRRIDGGAVPDPDPGSVSIGGVIEVFADAGTAARRGAVLQTAARGRPAFAERDFLAGPVLVRVSAYLRGRQAREYQAVLDARRVPAPAPAPRGITA